MDGRVRKYDIITQLSLLLSHLALSRKEHLERAIYIIVYMGQKYNSRLIYELIYPELNTACLRNVIRQSLSGCQSGHTHKFHRIQREEGGYSHVLG